MAKRGNFEDEEFERQWKEALEDASEVPGPNVWSNIERELTLQQVILLKRKAKVYQWATAAAVFIAAFLGINYLISDQVIQTNVISSDEFTLPENGSSRVGQIVLSDEEGKSQEQENNGSNFPVIFTHFNSSEETESDEVLPSSTLALNTHGTSRLNLSNDLEMNLERRMYIHPIVNASKKANRKSSVEDRFWTGVSLGSGSFEPNYQSGESNLLASSVDLPGNAFAMTNSARISEVSPAIREGMKAGTTNALGLNFGMKLTNKWIMETGIFYSQSGAVTQTNLVVESSRIIEPIAASSETKGVTKLNNIVNKNEVVEYSYKDVSMDNQFQFASLPVKAGYLLIDGKFNLIINAGLSTNLYLGNRLTDPESVVANVSIGPGGSSPYREISFTGLGGLQLGYSFLENFDVTIEPYLRQPITSLTKESSSFEASPSGLGVNTGIKYRFN